MIVKPFRSSDRGVATYHTNTLCPEGKAFASDERRKGDGGLAECEVCRALVGVRLAFGRVEESLRADLLLVAKAEVQGGFGILIWCPGSDEILLSEGAYEIHGLTATEPLVPTEIMADVIHPDDLSLVRSGLAEVMKGGSYDGRHRVVWPDGTVRWVRAKVTREKETITNPEHVLWTVVDITDYMGHEVGSTGHEVGAG